MKNILVLCYQLSPTKGSEYSVAWNYVKNMSRDNKLTVLYGVSGQHLGDVQEMDEYIQENDIPNVTFVPVLPNKWTKRLNFLNERNVFVYSFYFAYSAWQKQVYHVAKQLVEEQKFDLIHYLNPIGYREPGHLWKLDLPYMWGPINGMGNYPSVMFDFLPYKSRIKFAFRSFANTWQLKHSKSIRKAIQRTDLLLAATTECADICAGVFGKKAEYLPENGMTLAASLELSKFDKLDHQVRLIAVGSLDGRKNVLTIIRALEYSSKRNLFHLDIVGDGPLRSQLEAYTAAHKLDSCVTFHGMMPRKTVREMFQNAHLHVITSIGEGNPTTIWEAMSCGVPTVTVDHCGMHDTVSEATGYLIKVSSSDNIAKDLANLLDSIAEDPGQLISKAKQVVEDSKKYLWERRIPFFEECYDKCIANYKAKL